MNFGAILATVNKAGNRFVLPLISGSALGRQTFGRVIGIVGYTGRRSGKEITLPVAYFRKGDTVKIGVAQPESKRWWRNFLGEGAPITLTLAGATHTGHAVAHRDEKGRVTVVTHLRRTHPVV